MPFGQKRRQGRSPFRVYLRIVFAFAMILTIPFGPSFFGLVILFFAFLLTTFLWIFDTEGNLGRMFGPRETSTAQEDKKEKSWIEKWLKR